MEEWGVETVCAHLGEEKRYENAIVPPIFQSSLFTYDSAEVFEARESDPKQFLYTRFANPTTQIAEAKIAALEKMPACRLFASGMGAVTAAVMAATRSGGHVVCTEAAYRPTKYLLQHYLPRFGVETAFVDGTDANAVEAAIRPESTAICMESPGTFFYEVQDIEAICSVAKRRGLVTILDNSNATPYFQQPSAFGVDLVVHSVSKYLGGHSDLVLGAVCGREEIMRGLCLNEGLLLGATPDPFSSWLLIRSLRTLPLRMERHQFNALKVAEFLSQHPAVERVHYTGLPDHPQADLIRRQMSGSSGMLTFFPANHAKERVFGFCEALRLVRMGVSWGGHESLAAPLLDPLSGGRWFVRLSVGLETAEDLIEDLDQALRKA